MSGFIKHVTYLCLVLTLVSLTQGSNSGGQPLQLVAPNEDHTMLVLNQNNVDLLMSWNEPVAVVVVCGPLHSGKSFLSNQLRALNTSGFKLGPTTRPETRGLWMWSEPLRVDDHLIVFLDTEGLFASNVTEVYDGKIFAISALLSSVLVYNTVKFIDQSSIEYMEMLIRRAQLFELKARVEDAMNQTPQDNNANDHSFQLVNFGKLVWVVQDFVQEMVQDETPDEWLIGLLNASSSSSVATSTETSSSITTLFEQIHCRTLFIPDTRRQVLTRLDTVDQTQLSHDYVQDVESLRKLVIAQATPRELSGEIMTGKTLAHWLTVLVSAANRDALPEIPSVWHGFLLQQASRAKSDILMFFEANVQADMDNWKDPLLQRIDQAIMPNSALQQILQVQQVNAFNLFSNLTLGISISADDMQDLHHRIDQLHHIFTHNHEVKVKAHIEYEFERHRQDFKHGLSKLDLPAKKSDLERHVASWCKNTMFRAQDGNMRTLLREPDFKLALKSLASFIEVESDKLRQKNTELATEIFASAANNAIDFGVKFLVVDANTPMDFVTITSKSEECARLVKEKFANLTRHLARDYPALLKHTESTMKTSVEKMIFQYQQSNAARVVNELKRIAKTQMLSVSHTFDSESLPQTMKHIEQRSTQIITDAIHHFQTTIVKYEGISGVEEARLKFVEHCHSERAELFRRNHVKYDHLLARAIPAIHPMLEREVRQYWWPSNGLDYAKQIISEQLREQEHVSDTDMIEDLADRYITKNLQSSQQSFFYSIVWTMAIIGVAMVILGGLVSRSI
jgi:hypothetical protein